MRKIRIFLLTLILLALTAIFSCQSKNTCSSEALPDNPKNRTKLAENYFELVPLQKMMNDMGQEMATRMPPKTKEDFLEYWKAFNTEERMQNIKTLATKSLAKHMTTDELNAFIEFIKKPAGRSAMAKMKYYVADIMPTIQSQAIEAMQQFKPKNK